MPYITEERRMIQEQAREFTLNEVLPVANKLDPEKGDIPMDLRDKMAEMAIELDDGTTIEATHDSGIPWPDLARQRQALEAKYESLAVPVLGVAGAKRLHDVIENIDTLKDVGELARASAKS